MKKTTLILFMAMAWFSQAYAQEGLDIAKFFSDEYKGDSSVTVVEITGDRLTMPGLSKYKSISVDNNAMLAAKLEKAVKKDGISAKSKEVIFKKGKLYFGFYNMGGSGASRRYIYYLNQLPAGKSKTMIIFVEGMISEDVAKGLIKK